jgi:filamentous hemagglutinin
MQNRGFTPSVIEETIQRVPHSIGENPGTMAYYDSANDVTVILNTDGKVITISYGDINQ